MITPLSVASARASMMSCLSAWLSDSIGVKKSFVQALSPEVTMRAIMVTCYLACFLLHSTVEQPLGLEVLGSAGLSLS